MRAFLGRIAANAGASLTSGAVVLAIGGAFLSLGLTEVSQYTSPFSNPCVVGGLVVGGIGAVWCIGTFAAAMRATLKTDRFREQLGKAIGEGTR
jgi:NO-binding membrane sensor protein with MHYT domain